MPGPPSTILVEHGSGDMLGSCISSLRSDGVTDIVVVDNGSRFDSAADLPVADGVRLVSPGINLGYGAGANRGASTCSSDYILVANPDLVVHAGAISTLRKMLDADPTLAAVGPLTLRPNGSRYPSARKFPTPVDALGHAVLAKVRPANRFSRRYHQEDLDLEGPSSVDWVSGAFIMLRRTAFEEVGGFDESYFMYAEDMDLCWRLRRNGWGIAFVPGAAVTHQQGLSTASRPYRMLLAHHRSALRFEARTATNWRRAMFPLVAAVLAFRLLVTAVSYFLSASFPRGPRPRLG